MGNSASGLERAELKRREIAPGGERPGFGGEERVDWWEMRCLAREAVGQLVRTGVQQGAGRAQNRGPTAGTRRQWEGHGDGDNGRIGKKICDEVNRVSWEEMKSRRWIQRERNQNQNIYAGNKQLEVPGEDRRKTQQGTGKHDICSCSNSGRAFFMGRTAKKMTSNETEDKSAAMKNKDGLNCTNSDDMTDI